jgi:dipeptidyl-peptidase-4
VIGNYAFVDKTRIGIFGWSYGGLWPNSLFKAMTFKMAIAVAPVTNWRFYDSIYTERYMQTPGKPKWL